MTHQWSTGKVRRQQLSPNQADSMPSAIMIAVHAVRLRTRQGKAGHLVPKFG
jgi:hypothetical protein